MENRGPIIKKLTFQTFWTWLILRLFFWNFEGWWLSSTLFFLANQAGRMTKEWRYRRFLHIAKKKSFGVLELKRYSEEVLDQWPMSLLNRLHCLGQKQRSSSWRYLWRLWSQYLLHFTHCITGLIIASNQPRPFRSAKDKLWICSNVWNEIKTEKETESENQSDEPFPWILSTALPTSSLPPVDKFGYI